VPPINAAKLQANRRLHRPRLGGNCSEVGQRPIPGTRGPNDTATLPSDNNYHNHRGA
ncbi:hypothetical protein A2U01_0078151, partial [Trifolium medium]|nr:hypothetical protein [Trifolium medium]